DLSWTGLPEFVDDTVTDYSRPSPTVVNTSAEGQNKDSSTFEDVASPNPPKPFVKFVKPKDSQHESKSKEQETPKKSQVKFVKQYRHSNKRPKGNQRNWNNLKSYQLGPEFVLRKKPYFNYGDFSYLANDCRRRVQRKTTRSQNHPYKSSSHRSGGHRPHSQSKSKTDEKETLEKPPVKDAEKYRKPNKKPNVRGNQMNWNNLKTHQLGPDFVMKKKAYFKCGDFNHLAYECRKR
nr:ubiquitin hydrolase [Tanacetum cinerariifolium]